MAEAACLEMLQSSSNEHKLAGLLMLMKAVEEKKVDESNNNIREQILPALGPHFLRRLLKTPDSMSLSLAVMANLIQDTSLSRDKELCGKKVIAQVISTVSRRLVEEDNVANITPDVLTLFSSYLSNSEASTHHFLNSGGVKTLLSLLISLSSHHEELSIRVITTLSHPNICWKSTDVSELVTKYATISTAAKFALQKVLLNLLQEQEPQDIMSLVSRKELHLIRKTVLEQLLTSSLTPASRNTVFQLIYEMLSVFEASSWFTKSYHVSNAAFYTSGKFMSLVVKLTSVEVKMLLDKSEEVFIQSSLEEEENIMSMIPICYAILESALMTLASVAMDDDELSEIKPTVLFQLKESLSQVIELILQFILISREFLRKNSSSSLEALVFTSLRLIGAWLAEESEMFETTLEDLLPYMVTFTPSNILKTSTCCEKSGNTCCTAAAVVDSDDEEEPEEEEGSSPVGIDLEMDPLVFLLPGLMMQSASSRIADAFVDKGVVKRLLSFASRVASSLVFEAAVEEKEGGSLDQDYKLSLLTMVLGVLFNLMALRPDAVSQMTGDNAIESLLSLSNVLHAELASEGFSVEMMQGEKYVLQQHLVFFVLSVMNKMKSDDGMSLTQFKAVTLQWILTEGAPPLEEEESLTDCASCYDLYELIKSRAKDF